jgi:hypothetical protein
VSTDDEQRKQAELREYARSLSPEQWNLFAAQVQPPTDPASVRRSLAAAAAAMLATPKDHNGPTGPGSFAASVAARQPQPAPQPEPPAPQGFTANRAQGASGDGPPAPAQQSDWSTKPRIYPPGGAF